MLINSNANSIAAYYRAASLQATRTDTNFSISGSYLEITGGKTAAANTTDGVDLSSQVQEILDRIKEMDVFKVAYPDSDVRKKAKSLKDVEGDFMADFNDFSKVFGQMSSMMGLDSSQLFTMGLDGAGGMTVAGEDGATASKVQGALNNNSTMVARFAVMAARASLVDAGNTEPGFKDAYAQDPFAAIKDNIGALKERLLGFRVQAGNGSMDYGFMRQFSMQIEYSSYSLAYGTASDAGSDNAAESEAAAETVDPATVA